MTTAPTPVKAKRNAMATAPPSTPPAVISLPAVHSRTGSSSDQANSALHRMRWNTAAASTGSSSVPVRRRRTGLPRWKMRMPAAAKNRGGVM